MVAAVVAAGTPTVAANTSLPPRTLCTSQLSVEGANGLTFTRRDPYARATDYGSNWCFVDDPAATYTWQVRGRLGVGGAGQVVGRLGGGGGPRVEQCLHLAGAGAPCCGGWVGRRTNVCLPRHPSDLPAPSSPCPHTSPPLPSTPQRAQTPDWKPPAFEDYSIYELHVGSFTPEGTLAAAAARLEHVAALGFTSVQLMPLNEFGDAWGYNPRQLLNLDQRYGKPDDMRAFVDRAHALGLGVIVDVVLHHGAVEVSVCVCVCLWWKGCRASKALLGGGAAGVDGESRGLA